MEGKAKFIFPIVITAIIVFIVSAVVTFFNIGLRADFVPRWLSAFVVGWPVAAVTAFIAFPFARAVDAAHRRPDRGGRVMLQALDLARRIDAGELGPADVVDLCAKAIDAREKEVVRLRGARRRARQERKRRRRASRRVRCAACRSA